MPMSMLKVDDFAFQLQLGEQGGIQ